MYYCRSGNGSFMGTGGCLTNLNHNSFQTNLTGTYQRYGQYRLQFTDYNGNSDDDTIPFGAQLGDEDNDGSIVNDDDDIELGEGPKVISNPMSELYLINSLKKKRILFRWNYRPDPDAPA